MANFQNLRDIILAEDSMVGKAGLLNQYVKNVDQNGQSTADYQFALNIYQTIKIRTEDTEIRKAVQKKISYCQKMIKKGVTAGQTPPTP